MHAATYVCSRHPHIFAHPAESKACKLREDLAEAWLTSLGGATRAAQHRGESEAAWVSHGGLL